MKLSLENICNIEKADFNLNGITVIAGDNATGKSTVGKALHLILHSFYDIENSVVSERQKYIEHLLNIVDSILQNKNKAKVFFASNNLLKSKEAIVKELLALKEHNKQDIEKYLRSHPYFGQLIDNNENIDYIILEASNDISKALDTTFEEYFKVVANKDIEQIFSGVINNIHSNQDAKITLTIDNKKSYIKMLANKVVDQDIKTLMNYNVIYISNPFIFDDIDLQVYRAFTKFKNYYLIEQLISDNDLISGAQISVEKKLNNILNLINKTCKGNLVFSTHDLAYSIDENKQVPIHNISTGIKSFLIIKTLLLNGKLTSGSTLILDEPEIHLHPEWQLLYAQIIVLLQKEFQLKILLTTHSPYFIQALEAYSKKYNVVDKCEYYISQVVDNHFEFKNVTDNLDPIYEKFLNPLKIIKDIEEQNAC